MPLSPGQIINDRYRIVKPLGRGGFGAVYRAWDTLLERPCALKENLDVSEEAQNQFLREAKILAKLDHPNLPRVTDYFLLPGLGQYLVMDFVEGQDLLAMMAKPGGLLPLEKVIHWIDQVCAALEYLHRQSPPVIHRDIKPGNIRVTPDGKAILVDFGIAKVFDPQLSTIAGARAVTPGYSPIEQYGQGRTDARSDLYALGATLYHLVTGVHPPPSVDILSNDVPAPRPAQELNPMVGFALSNALHRAMQLRREDRFLTVADFHQVLVSPRHDGEDKKTAVVSSSSHAAILASEPEASEPASALKSVAAPSKLADRAKGHEGEPRRSLTNLMFIGILVAVLGMVMFLALIGFWAIGNSAFGRMRSADRKVLENLPVLVAPDFTDDMGIPMRLIPAGAFQMGNERGEIDEGPIHTVKLGAYFIDQFEVSNAQYALCVQAGVCSPPSPPLSYSRKPFLFWGKYYGDAFYNSYPVVNVTWEMSRAYCAWRKMRLPTEAEWEKAARGGLVGQAYPWGDRTPDCSLANYSRKEGACWGDTHPVGNYPPNGFGLYDMAGNVWEWVSSLFMDYPYQADDGREDLSSGGIRVIRGGSFNDSEWGLRTADRGRYNIPENKDYLIGFRCARSP